MYTASASMLITWATTPVASIVRKPPEAACRMRSRCAESFSGSSFEKTAKRPSARKMAPSAMSMIVPASEFPSPNAPEAPAATSSTIEKPTTKEAAPAVKTQALARGRLDSARITAVTTATTGAARAAAAA